MGNAKYNAIIDTVPATEYRKEILFRVAGDDSILVEYGREMMLDYMDVFRVMAVTKEIEKRKVSGYSSLAGFIETIPCSKTIIFHFDPRVMSMRQMIEVIKDCEAAVGDNRDVAKESFSSPLIEMPCCWEESGVRETNEKYLKEIKPGGSVDIDPVTMSHLTYLANYNGISREEFKERFLATDYLDCYSGFMLGLALFIPFDRRCTLRTSKCNPPRTWTKRGTLGWGGSDFAWYTMDAPGGYHIAARTSPQLQLSQKHPSFREDIGLVHPLDRVHFYEVDEAELLRIERLVDEGSSEFIYKKTPGRFSVAEWLEFEGEHKDEIEAWHKHIDEAARKAPIPEWIEPKRR